MLDYVSNCPFLREAKDTPVLAINKGSSLATEEAPMQAAAKEANFSTNMNLRCRKEKPVSIRYVYPTALPTLQA